MKFKDTTLWSLQSLMAASVVVIFAGSPAAGYDYDNEVANAPLLMQSCQKSLAEAKVPAAHKTEFCTCVLISVNASGPQATEIKRLVENNFMDELRAIGSSRPMKWNSINSCFR